MACAVSIFIKLISTQCEFVNILGDCVPLSIKCLFLMSDKHNYIDTVYLFYLILLRVWAVLISRLYVGHDYTNE